MSRRFSPSRRDFLKIGTAAGGGLLIGFYLPLTKVLANPAPSPDTFAPNAFLRIGNDETVTILVSKSEMGQGVYTSLPMLVAEELDADWNWIRVEAAPVGPEYFNTFLGIQMTGGSTSVRSSWEQLRRAGATARGLLIAAAAATWKVEPTACRAENGFVIHDALDHRVSFGQLVDSAAKLTPPDTVILKDPRNFKLIGKPTKRLDTIEKSNGTAIFGLDVVVPGMLTALIARPPVFGGKVRSVNADKTKAVSGVKAVVQIDAGVAVVAEGFWSAQLGRRALNVVWDEGPNAGLSSTELRQQYVELAKYPGRSARQDGNVAATLDSAATKVEAVYEVPYLAHAPMEPLNCVVNLRTDGCDIWTGTQFQSGDQERAAKITGLKLDQVNIHTTLLGGGFGRRANPASDFVVEAVQVAKAVGAPVKVVWTREDDIRGGHYRPTYYHALSAGLDATGNLLAWSHRIVGQSIVTGTVFEPGFVKDGIDPTSVEGAADLPYAIPNLIVDYHLTTVDVPVQWWRSVGHSHTGFVTECFIDKIAAAAGKDPFEFRRSLLGKHPRHRGVLELAAERAGWGTPIPAGYGRGIAVHASFGSFVAHVAEVSVSPEGELLVHRVVCAIDCGMVVNPDTIRAQMDSGIVYGLSAALYGEITIENGRVQQGNFDTYPVLRISQMPTVEVHIIPSQELPGGVGEPGVPPIAPAVMNAIFAATGKWIERLPVGQQDLRKS